MYENLRCYDILVSSFSNFDQDAEDVESNIFDKSLPLAARAECMSFFIDRLEVCVCVPSPGFVWILFLPVIFIIVCFFVSQTRR